LRRRLWFILAFLAPAVVAGALLANSSLTHAARSGGTTRFDPYLHRTNGDLADPINLIFRGTDEAAVAQTVQRVLGWSRVQGSAMFFYDQGSTHQTAWQFGFDLGQGSRLHMRLEQAGTAGGHPYVLAGVHRDDLVACGHVGHFFDQERDAVATAFSSLGYKVTIRRLDNTRPGLQCDGSLTAGDGTAAIIDLSSRALPAERALLPVGGPFPPFYLALP
jgi:hypothetical protein